jgi:hypothetical protein
MLNPQQPGSIQDSILSEEDNQIQYMKPTKLSISEFSIKMTNPEIHLH